ncbi:MAG: hypothetical protein KDA57_08435 [Planctomycetales bacterium]|nr:hypothetical protein [Planctomycetales bacterium]
MIRALAIKELRESAGLLALAALGMAWTIARLVGYSFLGSWTGYYGYGEDFFAFLNDDFTTKASIFVGGLAIGLGLKQTAWEHGRCTFYFLLHRPIERWQVVATKLAVGLTLMLGILVVAIVWYGWWAATPGKRSVPFEWTMASSAWMLMLTMPLVYFGAFLSGMRPGQWFGTRLAPLAGAIMWATFCNAVPFWWLTAALAILGYVCVLTAILYYSQSRDY